VILPVEPRGKKINRERTEKRRKLFKAFSASTALSSMILGGAQLASPTYAQFNDSQEEEIEIGACFIFPKVIEEDYRDLSVTLSAEVISKAKAAIMTGEQLKEKNTAISKLTSSDGSGKSGSNDNTGAAGAGGGTEDSVLVSQQKSLESQLSDAQTQLKTVNSKIQEIEKDYQTLTALSQSIKSYVDISLKEAKTDGNEKLIEIENLVNEINGIKFAAIKECTYDEAYFAEVLKPMEQAKVELNEVVKELEGEETKFKSLLDKYEKDLHSYKESLQSYNTDSARLESEINGIKSKINKVKEQIESEAKAKEEKEKNKQSPPAEKPNNNGKPANQDPAAKPGDSKSVPPAEGEKAAPPDGKPKDDQSDKTADGDQETENQPDAVPDETVSAQDSSNAADTSEGSGQ
jgi:predicted  nucleic acid-binding Zn-ribbon protein